jgi:glucokinase
MSYAIGVDLGGTRIKAVAVDEAGEILDQVTSPTRDDASAAWAAEVERLIGQLEAGVGTQATWLGLASPGMPARDGRSMAEVNGHLESLRGVDWTELLGRERTVPVLNDAHAALLGEVWRGAAVGCRDAVLFTLGTGVGGAAITGGRLLTGHLGRAAHLGHTCIDVDGPPGATGLPGSLEDAIGNRTVGARSGGRFASTADLVERHLSGDEHASRVWLRSVYVLACAIASTVNILDPEMVIVGGGIARADRALFDPLREYLDRVEWRPYGEPVRIVPAALGDLAGALGAARHAIAKPFY